MGHGDHWSAIQEDVPLLIEHLLPKVLEEGKVIGETEFDAADEAGAISHEQAWGVSLGLTPVRFFALVATQSAPEPPSQYILSAYPVAADGIPVEVEVTKVEEWHNPLEGIVHGVALGVRLAFFDPLFFQNRHRYQAGRRSQFCLGGIAYAIRKPKQTAMEITEGPLLDARREQLLREDPTADVSSVTSVTLSLQGMCGLFPREAPEDFDIRSVAEEVGYFEIEEIGFYRILCTVAKPDDQDLKILLYAGESVLGDYRPQPGDDFEAIVWLQGFLAE